LSFGSTILSIRELSRDGRSCDIGGTATASLQLRLLPESDSGVAVADSNLANIARDSRHIIRDHGETRLEAIQRLSNRLLQRLGYIIAKVRRKVIFAMQRGPQAKLKMSAAGLSDKTAAACDASTIDKPGL